MLIGQISLNISLCFYLVYFLPQLLLNFKLKDTQGVSVLTQGLLCLGYLSDLVYGFGCHMQWQYKLVTLVGLVCLFVQYIQFYQYGLKTAWQKKTYWLVVFLSLTWISYLISVVLLRHPERSFYDVVGLCAVCCWTICMFPQVVQNYLRQSAQGLSVLFVVLSLLIKICDIISAWAFNWDYPSKLGSVIFFFGSLILLLQVLCYAKKFKKSVMVAYR